MEWNLPPPPVAYRRRIFEQKGIYEKCGYGCSPVFSSTGLPIPAHNVGPFHERWCSGYCYGLAQLVLFWPEGPS